MLEFFIKHKSHGVIIPKWDIFRSEFIQESQDLLYHTTGFSGSYGIAIITPKNLHLFVDSRYTLQAKNESPNAILHDIYQFNDWLEKNNLRLTYDPWLWSEKELKLFSNYHPLPHLIDYLWKNRGNKIEYEISDYKKSGENTDAKIKKIDFSYPMIICDNESLSWLSNKRSFKKPYNPAIEAFGILDKENGLQILNPFDEKINLFIEKHEKIQIDYKTPISISQKIKNPVYKEGPILSLKAIKNPKEIEGIKNSHKLDGIAISKFLNWMNYQRGELTEISAQEKLLDFRKEQNDFIGESFPAISAVGSNASIIHYRAKENHFLKPGDLYLIDSGGQYLRGTTDVTRTIIYQKNTISQDIKEIFTRVLKGYLAIAYSKFPKGIKGCNLDSMARQFLWEIGLDYPHSTGHGVGAFLGVHEGPQSISSKSRVELKPGMILSIEPGYYKDNEFGMRHEDLVLVKEENGWICFDVLTIVPIDLNLVDKKMLNQREISLINNYQNRVYNVLKPHVSCNFFEKNL